MTGLMRTAAACLVCLLVAACAGTPTKPRDTTLSTMEKKIDALAEWAGSHNKVPDAAATKALTFRSASTRTWARIADGDVKLSELLSKGRRHFAHRGALIGYFPTAPKVDDSAKQYSLDVRSGVACGQRCARPDASARPRFPGTKEGTHEHQD